MNKLPDYILIYNTQDPQSGYHLFPCINSSIKEQNDMEAMSYPSPDGNYIVFSLGEELPSEPIDMNKLLRKLFPSWEKDVLFAPQIVKGEDIAMMVNESFVCPPLADSTQKNVLRFLLAI